MKTDLNASSKSKKQTSYKKKCCVGKQQDPDSNPDPYNVTDPQHWDKGYEEENFLSLGEISGKEKGINYARGERKI